MPDTLPVRWEPSRIAVPNVPRQGLLRTLWRGACGRCPVCGQGRVFAGWLRVVPACAVCAAPLGSIRADDAPPYVTIFIVAHVVIGTQVAVERTFVLSTPLEMALLLPYTALLVLGLIRPVKGATIALMARLGMMAPAPEVPPKTAHD